MRIQHNIMAMGAYRNYTSNVNAMKKNLEKLSSGYKINRAGDDAAGLAISEKMRAQITGLETAQKNAKDGISLVQTAEGALTEVHDMLNRMVTLATQSANGTYDNETDRVQLQKELDQLRTEIDRIADSSNFNGIQLLDGSRSAEGVKPVSNQFDLPPVTALKDRDTDTVLHQDEDQRNASTSFGLEMHNLTFSGDAGDKFTIKIGDTEMVGTLVTAGEINGADIANSLSGDEDDKVTFSIENEDGTTTAVAGSVTIDGHEYEITAGDTTTENDRPGITSAKFSMVGSEAGVDVSFSVSITSATGDGTTDAALITGTAKAAEVVVPTAGGVSGTGTSSASASVKEYNSTGRIDTTKLSFALDNTIDTTGASATPVATYVVGSSADDTFTTANATYTIHINDADIQGVIDSMVAAGTYTPAAGESMTIAYDSGKLQLKMGSNIIAETADLTAANAFDATTPTANFVGKDARNTVLGTIHLDDVGAALDNSELSRTYAATGMGTATITTDTGLDGAAITAAAVAKGKTGTAVPNGNVILNHNAGKVELKVGGTGGVVVGSADPTKINDKDELEFFDDAGNSLGHVKIANNGQLDASKIVNVDTKLTYSNANLRYTLGAVDHDKLAAVVRNEVETNNADLGDGKLSLSFDSTAGANAFTLKMGNTVIGSGTMTVTGTTGEIEIKKGSDSLLKLNVLNLPTGSSVTSLAAMDPIGDIGITVTYTAQDNPMDTTGLKADELGKAINTAAQAAGKTVAATDELKISYNADNDVYEMKIGNMLIGTASPVAVTGAGNNATMTLSFDATTAAGGAALGDVVVKGLQEDYSDSDWNGEVGGLGFTYNPTAKAAITANFEGLDKDKLFEMAEDGNVTADSPLNLVHNNDGSWSLKFGTAGAATPGVNVSADNKTLDFGDYGKVTFSSDITKLAAGSSLPDNTKPIATGLSYGTKSVKTGLSGDYQISATAQKNALSEGGDRLASTLLTLTDDMITDGASIFVAGKNYTFSTGKDTVVADGAVKVGISDLNPRSDSYMSDVVKRLTAAYDNDNTGVYTLGWDGKHVTVTETQRHGNLNPDGVGEYPPSWDEGKWDLRTLEGIQKSLGYSTAATRGSALTLQIGATADKFNQLDVSINDCHAAAMGIGDIDISTQQGASDAVEKIKAAINSVSDVRGTLGATQNRLDHTINNLSVMTENIQDAESTIRDTDVAAEMMEYTKNNILIQSAQAMLAQANQVPQGVLQLLQ